MEDKITISKTVEETIDLEAERSEIQRVEDWIKEVNGYTQKQKAELWDKQQNIQGWIDELTRMKARLAEYEAIKKGK